MAFSLQQSGDLIGADTLYRKAPGYAESWNNLGVIWQQQGKAGEARAAFGKALQLAPSLAEASLNLGQRPSNYWTQTHEKYMPGTAMLAIPSQRAWRVAYVGSLRQRLVNAAQGPLLPWTFDSEKLEAVRYPATTESVVRAFLSLLFAVCLLHFFFPTLPVREKPGPFGQVLEITFPGTAREWGCASGAVFFLWMFLVVQTSTTRGSARRTSSVTFRRWAFSPMDSP